MVALLFKTTLSMEQKSNQMCGVFSIIILFLISKKSGISLVILTESWLEHLQIWLTTIEASEVRSSKVQVYFGSLNPSFHVGLYCATLALSLNQVKFSQRLLGACLMNLIICQAYTGFILAPNAKISACLQSNLRCQEFDIKISLLTNLEPYQKSTETPTKMERQQFFTIGRAK